MFVAIRMEARHHRFVFVDDNNGFYEGINRSVAAGTFSRIIISIVPDQRRWFHHNQICKDQFKKFFFLLASLGRGDWGIRIFSKTFPLIDPCAFDRISTNGQIHRRISQLHSTQQSGTLCWLQCHQTWEKRRSLHYLPCKRGKLQRTNSLHKRRVGLWRWEAQSMATSNNRHHHCLVPIVSAERDL